MTEVASTKSKVNALILLFTLTYMVSYLTRINYGAVIVEMVAATGYGKDLLSLALTGSFITYGVGQIISGFIGDKVKPKLLIAFGFIVTILMNIIMIFCNNPYQMLAVWCVNGFAQAFMWPPLVKIMSSVFTGSDYNRASTVVSCGSSAGTMVIYFASFVLVSLTSAYQSVFIFSAVAGVIMLLIWLIFCPNVEVVLSQKATTNVENSKGKFSFPIVLVFIMLAIVLQGMLRDGVTTWMPTYIDETYKLGSAMSILSGVILPIFSVICLNLANLLFKKITNPVACATVMFTLGVVSSIALVFIPSSSPILSILFMAILTGAMHGVNLMLICMIPPAFSKTGKVSMVSGIINSCTYVGSALFTYGIALLAENLGWGFTLTTWLIISAAGAIICALCIKPWSKFVSIEN